MRVKMFEVRTGNVIGAVLAVKVDNPTESETLLLGRHAPKLGLVVLDLPGLELQNVDSPEHLAVAAAFDDLKSGKMVEVAAAEVPAP